MKCAGYTPSLALLAEQSTGTSNIGIQIELDPARGCTVHPPPQLAIKGRIQLIQLGRSISDKLIIVCTYK